jgi:hypothetical protein
MAEFLSLFTAICLHVARAAVLLLPLQNAAKPQQSLL